jgi:hypothetical protein
VEKETNLNDCKGIDRIIKVKVNFALEQATKAQSGSSGIALLFA